MKWHFNVCVFACATLGAPGPFLNTISAAHAVDLTGMSACVAAQGTSHRAIDRRDPFTDGARAPAGARNACADGHVGGQRDPFVQGA
ncbi:hypothetical protein ACU4HD_37395 [Cupriavidus basilensis]